MDLLLESAGVWLARAYMSYGLLFLLLPGITFVHLAVLVGVVYTTVIRDRGDRERGRIARAGRLLLELSYGFVNPLLYLTIVIPSMSWLMPDAWWAQALAWCAWMLFAAVWGVRLFGRSLDLRRPALQCGLRALLIAGLACLAALAIKDQILALRDLPLMGGRAIIGSLRAWLGFGPLYLIPALFLLDYLRAAARGSQARVDSQPVTAPVSLPEPVPVPAPAPASVPAIVKHGFFLMPAGAARVGLIAMSALALLTLGLAVHRRSDGNVRQLVLDQRDTITRAAARYDVDPRLIASIVYVTHRDQLSPFRGALERLAMSAWGHDRTSDLMLNRPLDISVGLAQIKPRTAQTAGLLAHGQTLASWQSQREFYWYRGADPVGDNWILPAHLRTHLAPPFHVPSQKDVVVDALLDDGANLATCALILALYQTQWEAANAAWSLRGRPEILATLYQIGFSRSTPHGAPRSNAFGRRVREVYDQPWLAELFSSRAAGAMGQGGAP